jgi:hypothetical protein
MNIQLLCNTIGNKEQTHSISFSQKDVTYVEYFYAEMGAFLWANQPNNDRIGSLISRSMVVL